MDELEYLEKQEAVLSLRVLQCINSAAYAIRREVRSIREATGKQWVIDDACDGRRRGSWSNLQKRSVADHWYRAMNPHPADTGSPVVTVEEARQAAAAGHRKVPVSEPRPAS